MGRAEESLKEATEVLPPRGYYKAPSREGKLHVSAWLAPEFKQGLRAVQAVEPEATLQDLLTEALTDLFKKRGVAWEPPRPKPLPTPRRFEPRRT